VPSTLLNPATKVFAVVAGLGIAIGLGFEIAVGESSGTVLLVAQGLVAAGVAVAVAALAGRDAAPAVPADAPPPSASASTPGVPAQGSMFPGLCAMGLGLGAVGAATGAVIMILALVVTGVGAAGWFGQSWREHPSWTPRVRERVRYRLLVPAALPFAMLGLAASIAIGVSRILLTVPEKAAVGVALVLAVSLLVAFFALASRPGLGRSALTALVVMAVLSVGGAGIAGATRGERRIEKVPGGPGTVRITARNIKFDLTEMTLARGEVVVFRNRDTGTFHNVAFYAQTPDGGQGRPLFNGQPIDRGQITYHPPPPPAGTYLFACDFHANMRGTLIVSG